MQLMQRWVGIVGCASMSLAANYTRLQLHPVLDQQLSRHRKLHHAAQAAAGCLGRSERMPLASSCARCPSHDTSCSTGDLQSAMA